VAPRRHGSKHVLVRRSMGDRRAVRCCQWAHKAEIMIITRTVDFWPLTCGCDSPDANSTLPPARRPSPMTADLVVHIQCRLVSHRPRLLCGNLVYGPHCCCARRWTLCQGGFPFWVTLESGTGAALHGQTEDMEHMDRIRIRMRRERT